MLEVLAFGPFFAAVRAVTGRSTAKKAEKKAATTIEQDLVHEAKDAAKQHTLDQIERLHEQYPSPQRQPVRATTMTNNDNEPRTPSPAPTSNDSSGSSSSGGWSFLFTVMAASLILYVQQAHFLVSYSLVWIVLLFHFTALGIGLALLALFETRENFIHLLMFYLGLAYALFFTNFFLMWAFARFLGESIFTDMVAFLLLTLPLLIFLVVSTRFPIHHGVKLTAEVLLAILLLGILIVFIMNYSIPLPETYIPVDTQQGVTNALGYLWGNLIELPETIKRGIGDVQRRTDPMYYMGQVERSNDGPVLGVRFENVGPIDRHFLPEQQPIIQGYITAQSFLSDSIFVTPSCQTTGYQESFGGVPSQPSVEVFHGQDAIFDCRFPTINRTNHYPVRVSGTFDFETWAYTRFDFVFDDKIRELASLNQNIHQTLNIERVPVATFSQGPVEIGMGGSNLPIAVHQQPPFLRNAHIGFNVGSRWHNGEINRVHALELILPEGFTIGTCNRSDMTIEGPVPDENVLDAQGRPIYNKFIFRSVFEQDAPFTSVRCELQLDRLDVLSELYSSDKAPRTFIVAAQYRYTINQNTEFRIQNY